MANTKADAANQLERGTNKKRFLYEQIADKICAAIGDMEFRAGERITSMDELSAAYEVNKITVIKAVRYLAERGVLDSIPSTGTYVSENALDIIRNRPSFPGHARAKVLTIGIVSREMKAGETGFYHIMMNEAIREELGRKKANMVLLPAADIGGTAELTELIRNSFLDGVIYVGEFPKGELAAMLELKTPGVVLDNQPLGVSVNSICLDNVSTSYQAVEHLLELGHSKIGIVMGRKKSAVTAERHAGACMSLSERGQKPFVELDGDFTRESGYKAGKKLVAMEKRPTAVFCMNDEMAIGLMTAFREVGLAVPGGVSVVGIDDIPMAADPEFNLTTMAVPIKRLGSLCVNKLLESRDHPGNLSESIKLNTELVIRGSTVRSEG